MLSRPRSLRLALVLLALGAALRAASPFAGVWTGEIVAPNGRTAFGLAFTDTEKGLLVSLDFPAMFLHSVNFGPASIQGDTFTLPPLNLTLRLSGDTLTGTFALAKLPVALHRGGTFPPVSDPAVWPAAPAPAWSRALGASAWASPVAFDGAIYAPTVDGKLHAVSATDGRELWTWTGPYPLYGNPLVTADSVYLIDEHGDLVRIDRPTGGFIWRTPLHDEALAGGSRPKNETFNHRAPSPVIDEKRGLVFAGSTDGGIYAVRVRNGAVAWRHAASAKIYAPLALVGDEAVAACYDGTVLVLNRRNQRETLRTKLGGSLVSAPVIVGDRIVLGARDYLLYGLDRKTGAVAWRDSYWFSWVESTPRFADGLLYIGGSDFRRVSAIDPVNGHMVWSTDVLGLTWGTPAVSLSTVYAGTAGQTLAGTVIQHSGGLVALDRRTGSPKWRWLAPVPPGADFVGFAGSLALVDGKIVGATVDGTLLAFPAE